jgi:choline dehydrogenase
MRIDNPTIPAYVQGATEAGLPRNEDYNGATQLGAAIGQTSQKNGLRESTARSYLAPALRRENLTLRTHAQVSRILFEGDRAVGVEYVSKGRTHRVRAEREVVVCGGAIASPKILMVSGIGPEAELRRHGVEVIADVPGVGQNLMEHPHAFMKFQVNVSTLNTELKPLPAMKHGLDFLLRRRGALTSNFNQGILFAESPTAKWVDLEMQMYAFGVNAVTAEEADEYGLSHEIHQVQLDKDPMITMLPAFLRPSHRGSIGLRSSDPAAKPVIRYELVGHPDDMEGMLAGVKLAREIARTPSMRKLITAEVTPGPDVRTDDDIRGYLRVAGFTGKHPSGTCRIGTDDDAVVDPELKVRGVRGLRVVDASVMPQVTSGNTNSPTIMIAERAADLIKADRLQSLIACRPASAQVALAR